MLTEQQLNAIAQLLQRITLSPSEIPAFSDVMQAIGQEITLTQQRQSPNQPQQFPSGVHSDQPVPCPPE
jgi:hypothetical protein